MISSNEVKLNHQSIAYAMYVTYIVCIVSEGQHVAPNAYYNQEKKPDTTLQTASYRFIYHKQLFVSNMLRQESFEMAHVNFSGYSNAFYCASSSRSFFFIAKRLMKGEVLQLDSLPGFTQSSIWTTLKSWSIYHWCRK